jgi:hypothetical protein
MIMRTLRRTKAPSLLVILATLSLGIAPARAQMAPLGAEASQKADDLFRIGKEQYKTGKLREAYDSYRGAWALKQSYDIAANLANTELLLGMKRDAAEHFAMCLRTFAATGSKPQQEVVKKQFDEARQEIGALLIKVSVDGAEVFVDGKSVGRAPLKGEVFVEAGTRTVEAKLSGYEPVKQSLSAVKGAPTLTVTLELSPAKASAAATPAGTAPTAGEPATPGKPGASGGGAAVAGTGASSTSPLLAGQDPDKDSKDDEVPTGRGGVNRTVLGAGSAATGVGLVVGVMFALMSNGKAGAAESQRAALVQSDGPAACTGVTAPAGCTALTDAIGAKDNFANIAVWSFISAGVIGAGTLIYAFVAPKAPQKSGMLVPVVTTQGGALLVRGTW